MFRSSLLSPSLHFLHERSKTENGLFSQPARARSRRGSDLQGREAERIATLDPKGCEERERDRQVSLCVQRRRREQKKNSSSNSPLPPPQKKKKPETGYRSHPREQPAPREHRVSAKKEPSQRAETALRAMGAVGPPLPPSSAAEAEDFVPPAAPSSAGTGVAERASEGIASSTVKPGETFMGKEGGGK